VKLLLDNGAEVNTRGKFGESPLHNASRKANEPMILLLLQNGADLDSSNDEKESPTGSPSGSRVSAGHKRRQFTACCMVEKTSSRPLRGNLSTKLFQRK
ncbi:hypothetical protein K469DRAFT_546051, partial [Zopfia rhizophila CBS 207.26]